MESTDYPAQSLRPGYADSVSQPLSLSRFSRYAEQFPERWLGPFVVIIMLADLARPSLKYLLQRGFCGSGDVGRWNWVNEYIGNSIVEYASCNVIFAKNESGALVQTKYRTRDDSKDLEMAVAR